jgi:hypothetical protein
MNKFLVILFLCMCIVGFTCSSVSAAYENDKHVDVWMCGGNSAHLKIFSYTEDGKEYDHATGTENSRWTWLAVNNQTSKICGEMTLWIFGDHTYIYSDKWYNNVDNIKSIYLESNGRNSPPIMKMYLMDGSIIDGDIHYE